ncbi:MAG TPA: hypothetical protein VFN61_16325 [Acidimicrobiales bacterium]|nr:hypothetical protein [Acidimicrobiales bacterium]
MPVPAERAVIVGALRTPYGSRGGALAGWHPVDLSARVLDALVETCALAPALVDRVIWAAHSQVGAQAANVGRRSVLAAGWPETVPAATIDAHGASSLEAVLAATESVLRKGARVVVAGGVELASAVPLGAALAQPAVGRPMGARLAERYRAEGGMAPPGLVAEHLAASRELSRRQLDDWAIASVQRALACAGTASDHLVSVGPVQKEPSGAVLGKGRKRPIRPPVPCDEALVAPMSPSAVRALPPAYLEGGVVTAANFALEGDGAAAVAVTTSSFARANGLRPLAAVLGCGRSGCSPTLWPLAATGATRAALDMAGLSPAEIGWWRVLESSAAAAIAWGEDMGVKDLNPGGGELATTCPLGAAGAGMLASALGGGGITGKAVVAAAGELGVGAACIIEPA